MNVRMIDAIKKSALLTPEYSTRSGTFVRSVNEAIKSKNLAPAVSPNKNANNPKATNKAPVLNTKALNFMSPCNSVLLLK